MAKLPPVKERFGLVDHQLCDLAEADLSAFAEDDKRFLQSLITRRNGGERALTAKEAERVYAIHARLSAKSK